MTATEHDGVADLPDAATVGEQILALRKQKGLTQKALADLVQAAPSWVSQVESGTIAPSPARIELLAMLLGDELQVSQSGKTHADRQRLEALGFACLWRARADLLARLALVAESRAQRLRLDQISRQILSSAGSHPKVQRFVRDGQILTLPDLARQAPRVMKHLLLAELSAMKLDAPTEIGIDRSKVLDMLDFAVADLGLGAEVSQMLVRASEVGRKRPRWQELPSTGGALGTIQALAAPDADDLLVLLGHDPVAWFGFGYVSGTWLVQPALPLYGALRHGESPPSPLGASLEALAGGVGVGGVGVGAVGVGVASAVGALSGSILLGPVLGAALLLASAKIRENSKATRAALLRGSEAVAEAERAACTATLRLCEAFGRHWVRVELTKLIALYRSTPAGSLNGQGQIKLPPMTDAVRYLNAVAQHARAAFNVEADAAGTRSHDRIERLRELADIADTLQEGAQLMNQSPDQGRDT